MLIATNILQNRIRLIKLLFWLFAISLGALQAWTSRFEFSSGDSIPYLEIGEAYISGDWNAAINAYWSPLYSWLLGIALFAFEPSPEREFLIVKLANLLVLVFSLACFEFLLQQFIRDYQRKVSVNNALLEIPEWAWVTCGYSLCLWASLQWISVHLDSPDMATAGFVYLAAGLILRIQNQATTWITFAVLGVVLGFGYLSKSVMFPLSFVFLGLSIYALRGRRGAWGRAIAAVVAFAIVAGPFVAAISIAKGRLTIGDAGKLNYVWSVTKNAKPFSNWQGDQSNSGIPKHPTRRMFDDPPVYEFGTPVAGTYPVWYDPSYWYEGVVVRFDAKRQIMTIIKNVGLYYDLFLFVLVLIYVIVSYGGGMPIDSVAALRKNWSLLVPAIAGLAAYMIGTDMKKWFWETRYIAPFIVLLFAAVFSSVRLDGTQQSKRLVEGLSVIVAIVMSSMLVFWNVAVAAIPQEKLRNLVKLEVVDSARVRSIKELPDRIHLEIYEGLMRLGIQSGDKIVHIGNAYGSYWARLARVKIIAQIEITKSNIDEFWQMSADRRLRLFEVLKQNGAAAVITWRGSKVPEDAVMTGWQRIGNTDWHAYIFRG